MVGATVSGTQSIAYDAQDADSGVRLVQLLIDGNPAGQNDYVAECPYTNFAACPGDESGTISWNTASIADGQHSVELVVENAAGNTRPIYLGTVTTHNAPNDTSLGALLPTSTLGISSLGSVSPNGSAASEGAQLRLGVKPAVSRSFAHSALGFDGRLTDQRGRPIVDATVDVLERRAGSSQTLLIGHARSRADGSLMTSVPAGSSRQILLAYRAFAGDARYAAQASIQETVAAGVQMHIAPRRTRATGTIVLSGKVQGPIPPQGAIVELLVRYRGRWEPFRAPRTDSSGRFRVPYQFQGAVGRFPFRAEVPGGQAGFPFADGYSRIVDVAAG